MYNLQEKTLSTTERVHDYVVACQHIRFPQDSPTSSGSSSSASAATRHYPNSSPEKVQCLLARSKESKGESLRSNPEKASARLGLQKEGIYIYFFFWGGGIIFFCWLLAFRGFWILVASTSLPAFLKSYPSSCSFHFPFPLTLT